MDSLSTHFCVPAGQLGRPAMENALVNRFRGSPLRGRQRDSLTYRCKRVEADLGKRRTKQMWVLRTLCDAARGRRLATTPGGAGRVPAGVRGARSLPPDASAEQGNRPTPCVRARLPTWWFDFLDDEGGRSTVTRSAQDPQMC